MHSVKYIMSNACYEFEYAITIISQGFLCLTVALAGSGSVGALVSIFREFNGHTEYWLPISGIISAIQIVNEGMGG